LKKCKVCKNKFEPTKPLQSVCDFKCALEHAKTLREKQVKKEVKEYKAKTKPLSKHIAEAQTAINAYVRARDAKMPCISCGCLSVAVYGGYRGAGGWDSGHFLSRGAHPNHRFNLNNIFKQCVSCNRFKSGNSTEMRKGVILRIGLEKVEALENDNSIRRFDKEYCERIKKIFNKKIRLKKARL